MILVRIAIQTFGLALGQIWANKVRSLLTTLGVIIGVASVVAVIAALQGLRATVLQEFEKLGAKRVYIDGTLPRSQWHSGRWRDVQLKIDEVKAIRDRCESITSITPEWWGSYAVEYGDRKVAAAQTVGIWPTWHDIVGRQVIQGRPFTAIDDSERLFVCLINDKAIEELDLPREPVGEFILLAGRRFKVVGVVETVQLALFGGGDTSTEVFVPFGTAQVLNPDGWINDAWGSLASPDKVGDAKAEIGFVLSKMRNLRGGDEPTYQIEVLQQFIDQFNAMAAGITAGAGGIVGISLLVGGIGIMNIMLVSVSERTREIGLRKAIGARPMVVMIQFLVEAVTLCLAGGAIGLGVGQGLIMAIKAIPDSPLKDASVPAWAVLLAVGFSAGTGVIFGMFPAIKASRLDPIEALRHE
ncbi:MAG: ABC transporter permease [Phycisphaerales bacterium]|nr:ABC transporter permease [Phycisphaerales bacterium]